MRVLHIAAGNRWTGAAAPAFAEVEALRAAGADAHYAYVGGYKLEAKLRGAGFAHPLVERAQNPAAFLRSVSALTSLARSIRADFVHAHLTYDHWLALLVARRCGARIARTFHSRRVLRSDPFTRWLTGKTDRLFVVNDAFRSSALLHGRRPAFTPPPLDLRQFHPQGEEVRARYGIASDAALVMMIGKLSKERGFETGLHAFERIRARVPHSRLMIVGHGEHREALEQLATALGIGTSVVWAGYHEDDLAEHYRAADALLFTAAGSDAGHRAILEAMACGVPPATAPLEGVEALLSGIEAPVIAQDPSPEAIAACAMGLLGRDRGALRAQAAAHAERFGYEAAAQRLIAGYGSGSGAFGE